IFDTSSDGHIPAGDQPVQSAIRVLKEELGLVTRPEELLLAGTFSLEYTRVFHGAPFHDNEVSFVYFCTTPVDINKLTLQEEEISEVAWFNLDDVYRWKEEKDPRFCIPQKGLDILMHYVGKR
ncbi:MAG: NUDIX domain-containing protein, partial [Spirochaetales bacterium]|nr:NUDIX domain-containing protein [Candidatus Physcosoma equi]